MTKIISVMMFLMGVFILLESLRIVSDLIRIKNLGEVHHTKHEWGQMYQVPIMLMTVFMSTQTSGDQIHFEVPIYIGILVVTIVRIMMGHKIAEEGILMSSRVCFYHDIRYWEYDNLAEKEIKIKVPYKLNNNRLRTFKLKVSAKEKRLLLELFRAHGIEKKGIDHHKNDSNQ